MFWVLLSVSFIFCSLLGSQAWGDDKLDFNAGWRFIREDVPAAENPGLDDRAWALVPAPHTYNETDTFDDLAPAGHQGERDQFGGKTVYRKSFDTSAAWRGKKVFIEFEAVRQVAEVYLNGKFLGKSENGFLPFGFDLTPQLAPSGRNVLTVKVDNAFMQDEDGQHKWSTYGGGALFPWNNPHWHPAHGGIYRNVFLHVKDPVHVTLPLYSNLETTGVYAYAGDIHAASAKVGVEAEAANESTAAVTIAWQSEVRDAAGKTVLTLTGNESVAAGARHLFKAEGSLANPHLWSASDPYLYSVHTTVSVDAAVKDAVITPFGVRSVAFTKDQGCLLNGQSLRLHGWGQKSTDEWAGLGTAFPDWMHFESLRLMKEAGGNFIRWGHTAAGPAQIASADRLGILTLQPGVDGEGDYGGHAWEVRAGAFRDALVYYRNHPSIVIWEGGNQNVSTPHATELHGYFEKFDPHGGRAYAHRRPGTSVKPFLDVEVTTEGEHKYSDLPGVEGEYNREESPRRVWDNFSPPDFGYKWADGTPVVVASKKSLSKGEAGEQTMSGKQSYSLTAEAFAVNQVAHYYDKIYSKWPTQNGGANWIFSDGTHGGRNSSEVTRASGEVDAVRLPKEAYFACQAMFRDDPQVHIVGHWTYSVDKPVVKDVFVVANTEQVELLVNGKSLGVGKPTKKFLFTFKDVAFSPGAIEARGLDAAGKSVVSSKIETAGPPRRLKLTSISGPGGWVADGSDILLVDVEAVDAQGRRCPTVQQRVDFELSGAAIWRGGYNSGKEHSTNHPYLDIESGINRVAIRSKLSETGTVQLTATSKGLEAAKISLKPRPVVFKNGVTSGP